MRAPLKLCLCGHIEEVHDRKGCFANKCACAGFIEAYHGGVEL